MAVDVTDRMAARNSCASCRVRPTRACRELPSPIAMALLICEQKIYRDDWVFTGREIGRDLNHLFAESEEANYLQIQEELSRTGSWEGSVSNTRKSGERYWNSVSNFRIRDKSEATTHLAVSKDNITEKKRTEPKLQNAIERAGIAHRAKSDFLQI